MPALARSSGVFSAPSLFKWTSYHYSKALALRAARWCASQGVPQAGCGGAVADGDLRELLRHAHGLSVLLHGSISDLLQQVRDLVCP